MDFEWPDEAVELRAGAVEFGRGALSASVADDDRDGRFPAEKWRRLAEWGYFSLAVPTELGGSGVDPLTALLVTEGLGEGCEDGGLVFSAAVQAWVVTPSLLRFASDPSRERLVPRLATGRLIGAFAISEPDTGS